VTTTTGFLAEYEALERSGMAPTQVAQVQVGLVLDWLFGRPAELFAELREHRPILATAGPVLVSRYQDVAEVANLETVFGTDTYEQAMRRYNGGPNFLLGIDDREEHDHDRALLQLAMRRTDAGALRAWSAEFATAAIERALPGGRLDVTDAYARTVAAQVMNRYYYGARGPSADEVLAWSRAMYGDIFYNFAGDPALREAGTAAVQAFRECLDALIARGAADQDTVLDRLLAQGSFSDARIRDNLIGCTVGIADNVGSAFANALDVLFEHPSRLSGLTAAATSGDDELVLRHLLEALRFHPTASTLVRVTRGEATLAKGRSYEQTIAPGKLVFASTGSAMMDARQLDEPEAFDLERPPHHYLHFGLGLHRCLGEQIACIQLVELAKALVRLPNLRRAPGPAGRASSAGGFPNPFVVDFG
jgi:cytochrome P450